MSPVTPSEVMPRNEFTVAMGRLQNQVRIAIDMAMNDMLRDCKPGEPPLPTGLPVHFKVGDFLVTDLTRIDRPMSIPSTSDEAVKMDNPSPLEAAGIIQPLPVSKDGDYIPESEESST